MQFVNCKVLLRQMTVIQFFFFFALHSFEKQAQTAELLYEY